MKSRLEEMLDKHRQEMASQETTISELRKEIEESNRTSEQSSQASARITAIENELQMKSEALDRSRQKELSLNEQSNKLQERLHSMEGQLEEVLWCVIDLIYRWNWLKGPRTSIELKM